MYECLKKIFSPRNEVNKNFNLISSPHTLKSPAEASPKPTTRINYITKKGEQARRRVAREHRNNGKGREKVLIKKLFFFFVPAALHGMKKLDKTDEVDKSRRFGLKDGCWERKGIFHRQPVCLSVKAERRESKVKSSFRVGWFSVDVCGYLKF